MEIPVCVKDLDDWELYYVPLRNGGRMYVHQWLVEDGAVSFPCPGKLISLGDKDVILIKSRDYKAFTADVDIMDLKLAEKQVGDQQVKAADTCRVLVVSVEVGGRKEPIFLTDENGDMFVLSDSNHVFPIDKRDVAAILRCSYLLKPKEGGEK